MGVSWLTETIMILMRERTPFSKCGSAVPITSTAIPSLPSSRASRLSLLFISSGHQRILRRRWRRSFRREGGKMSPETAFGFVFLPVGKALGAAGSAAETMAIQMASSALHENPQTEPRSVQAASRSYR